MSKFEDKIEQAYWDFDAERARTGAERDAFKRQMRNLRGETLDLADEARFLLSLLAGADLHREDAIRLGVLRNNLAANFPQTERYK